MQNIIWTKKELSNIKKIILTKCNLKLNEEGKLVQFSSLETFTQYYHPGNSLYSITKDELENLFYIDNREKIEKILEKAVLVKADPNNKSHYGLIMALSKINPNHHDEIFIIFNEIIALYEKVISNMSHIIVDDCENTNLALEKIKNVDQNWLNDYIIMIKKELNDIFSFSNGINECEIFKPLIDKLDNAIEPRLIARTNLLIGTKLKAEIAVEKNLSRDYKSEFSRRYQKERIDQIKSGRKKIYGC